MVDEEDTICAQEHHFHPDTFYQRLQLTGRPGSKRQLEKAYRSFGIDPAAVDAFMATPNGFQAPPTIRQPLQAPPSRRRQGIGEMAVRTAVRATIWQLVASLFRR